MITYLLTVSWIIVKLQHEVLLFLEPIAVWHNVKNYLSSKECPIGYFLENCSSICPYPLFGRRCIQKCSCDKQLCDFVHGCTGKYYFPGTFSQSWQRFACILKYELGTFYEMTGANVNSKSPKLLRWLIATGCRPSPSVTCVVWW